MNIFILDLIASKCAQMHCDKHVIKMILETCQMLCTAWHLTDPEYKIYKPPYKIAHKNHPCTKWTRESLSNYNWLCELGLELCKEYTYRYGKVHASQKYITEMSKLKLPINDLGFTTPAQAMPQEYKNESVIQAYRNYYFYDKRKIHSWKGKINSRDKPQWIKDMEVLNPNI